ncbi:GspH/FimT family pseudopilin [Arenimonas alkanexedens]
MRIRRNGFSLTELTVTVAVLALVMAAAMPSFRAIRERHAALGTSHSLTVALMSARMAAIQRGRPVTVCPSQNGRECRQDLIWDDGWLVYADPGRTAQPADATAILWVEQRARGHVAVRGTTGRHRVRYQPTGFAGGNNASLRLCTRDGRHLATVVVNVGGRARSEWVSSDPPSPCPYLP